MEWGLVCMVCASLNAGMYLLRAPGTSYLWDLGQKCTMYEIQHRRLQISSFQLGAYFSSQAPPDT